MKTVIGISQDKPFSLAPIILADTRALICASSGAGKSHLLRLLAENIAEKIQTIIIDPEGEFSSLREALDILIVGENGDIKPDVKSAGILARKLTETGVSVVVDIYDIAGKGDPWDKRRLWVYAFINGLMNVPKSLYHPMVIMIDEAHNFAMEKPEKGGKELTKQYFEINESPSILARSAVRNLMSAGRKRGFGGILATQRVSKIDKDSIADARNIFIGGTNLDLDQERAGDMLGLSKKESVTLRDLDPGQFYCFGPAFGKRGVFQFQAGQVKTTHPKAGQRLNVNVPKASSQMSKIVNQFKDLPQAAEEEVKNLASLQSEVTQLKRELSSRPTVQSETKVETVKVPFIPPQVLDLLQDYTKKLERHLNLMESIKSISDEMKATGNEIHTANIPIIQMSKEITRLMGEIKSRFGNGSMPYPASPKPVHLPKTEPGERVFTVARVESSNESITTPEQRILDAIAWFESIGIYDPQQVAVAFLAGYSYGGGAFNNPRGRLNTRKLVSYRGKGIALTDEGRAYANKPDSALTKDELQKQVLSVLPAPHRVILQSLLSYYPDPISKAELSESVGKRGGAFNNPLGRLRSLGLIEYPSGGMVVAKSFLFME